MTDNLLFNVEIFIILPSSIISFVWPLRLENKGQTTNMT